MHIVLVEDDEVIRETTQISLERFGYTVTAFEDGREGYEFVTANGADAVLLDLMLPTMNGASITRAIRERSTVPIIVISARSDPIDIVQSLEAGADDYLTKPFDMQVLNARIRAVVRRFITAGTGSMGYSPAPAAAHTAREAAIGPGGRIIGGGELPDVLGPTPGFDSREPTDTGPLPVQQVPTRTAEQWAADPGEAPGSWQEPQPAAVPAAPRPTCPGPLRRRLRAPPRAPRPVPRPPRPHRSPRPHPRSPTPGSRRPFRNRRPRCPPCVVCSWDRSRSTPAASPSRSTTRRST